MVESVSTEVADHITLPVLGSRTVAQHQRILFATLIGALAVLAVVTFCPESRRQGRAAAGATGQGLMQSQRLAKSVSQAVVGSASLPDVADSADILTKSARACRMATTNCV